MPVAWLGFIHNIYYTRQPGNVHGDMVVTKCYPVLIRSQKSVNPDDEIPPCEFMTVIGILGGFLCSIHLTFEL